MKHNAQKPEVVVEVSQEEYQADLDQGLQDDEVLKPGRHPFKRGDFLARHGITPDEAPARTKVRITINLDLDVLTYFKRRAAEPNAAPYQTQINNALREAMERGQANSSSPLEDQIEALLTDSRFIDAVAERVQTRLP